MDTEIRGISKIRGIASLWLKPIPLLEVAAEVVTMKTLYDNPNVWLAQIRKCKVSYRMTVYDQNSLYKRAYFRTMELAKRRADKELQKLGYRILDAKLANMI